MRLRCRVGIVIFSLPWVVLGSASLVAQTTGTCSATCGDAGNNTYYCCKFANGIIADGFGVRNVPTFTGTPPAAGVVTITLGVKADMDDPNQGVDLAFNSGTVFPGHGNLLEGAPFSCTTVYDEVVTATASQWNSQ